MDSPVITSFDNYVRRFGVEIEVNALDGRSKPSGDTEIPPHGIHYVANVVAGAVPTTMAQNPKHPARGSVECAKWHHTHHNNIWIIKPDSSCGMEVCSPVSKGSRGVREIANVVRALRDDPLIEADSRCSLHVHIEVIDLTGEELAAVLAWWIKCEWTFFHSIPDQRKRNNYCQFIGQSDLFDHDSKYSAQTLVNRLGNYKYFSVNSYHLAKGRRPTIEFRVAESEACFDAEFVSNWIKLLVHFVETAKERGMPEPYEEGNQWTSWLWLEPEDVMSFLGFDKPLDAGMEEVKQWFIQRMKDNVKSDLPGIWVDELTDVAVAKINLL